MTRAARGRSPSLNNVVAEWFGHRIYPHVRIGDRTTADQKAALCPFLSRVEVEPEPCVKKETSRGVCTISSTSNGQRQDWVVCPYRIFEPTLFDSVAARLYGITDPSALRTFAAPTLKKPSVQKAIRRHLAAGVRVLVYFDQKLGGEISLRATPRSPEMSFDVTLVELVRAGEGLALDRFGIVEAQTMDFHGSYAHAVSKLKMATTLFPDNYHVELRKHPEWAAERIEGPNIANVVKRTFWQMLFKFSFGRNDRCAGTALILPEAVWDSWQPFLAQPELRPQPDGTFALTKPDEPPPNGKVPSWIYIIDIDGESKVTPNPIAVRKIIASTADALNHYALVEAPNFASEALFAADGIYATLRRRIHAFWPAESLQLRA